MRHEALFALALCACWREQPPRVERVAAQPAAVVEYHPPPRRDPRPKPEDAQVGYWTGATFVPASTIRLAPGVHYGWRIRLPCASAMAFKETLALPGPTTWGAGSSQTTISPDQSTATTTSEASCVDGWIEHGWYINGSDPPGEYEVTVEIDGWATTRFRTTFAP